MDIRLSERVSEASASGWRPRSEKGVENTKRGLLWVAIGGSLVALGDGGPGW